MGDRSHLSIGEVLSLLQDEFPDVTISKIRFLESQGLLDPERTPSGYRKFYEDDIERLRWILTQQKEHFLPLKVIKDRLVERDAAPPVGEASGDDPAVQPVHEAPPTALDDPGETGAVPATAVPAATTATTADGSRPEPIWMADAAKAAARAVEPPAALPFAVGEGARRAAPASAPVPRATPNAAGARDRARAGAPDPAPTTAPAPGAPVDRRAGPLDLGPTSVSLTAAELASASGLTGAQLEELQSYGLVEGRTVGSDVYFDGDALVVAQKAAGFIAHGIEPRHLRMFKVAAEREAGFLEQVVMPMLKQRSPGAREQAVGMLGELASLGQSMRAALLRHALRDHLS